MLTMREEQIAELLVKEEKLQKTLEDKLVAEQNFKKERKQLVKVHTIEPFMYYHFSLCCAQLR